MHSHSTSKPTLANQPKCALGTLVLTLALCSSALLCAQSSKPQVWLTDPTLEIGAPRTGQLDIIGGMVQFIDEAQSSIDFAMLRFDILPIVDSLIRAHQRGVAVRVLTDDNALRGQYATYYGKLSKAGIPVRSDRGVAVNVDVHHKFVIRDRKWVWNGDWNASYSDTWYVAHSALTVESKELAAQFTAGFEDLFELRPVGLHKLSPKPITVKPVPLVGGGQAHVHFGYEEDLEDVIVRELAKAKSHVDVAHAVFSNQRIAQMLAVLASRGVRVRVAYSTPLGWTPYLANLERFGAQVVRVGPKTTGTKTFLIDDVTIINGSWNCTIDTQHENVLILHGVEAHYRKLAAYFEAISGRGKNIHDFDVILSPGHKAIAKADSNQLPPPGSTRVTQSFSKGESPFEPTCRLVGTQALTSQKKGVEFQLRPTRSSTEQVFRVVLSYAAEHSNYGVRLPPKVHSWVIPPDMYKAELAARLFKTTMEFPESVNRYRVDLDIQQQARNGAWNWIANYVLFDPSVLVAPGVSIVHEAKAKSPASPDDLRVLLPGPAWEIKKSAQLIPNSGEIRFLGPLDSLRLLPKAKDLKGFAKLQVTLTSASAYVLYVGYEGPQQWAEIQVPVLADGVRHCYEVDLGSHPKWKQLKEISGINLRLDFTGTDSVIHSLHMLR